MSSLVLAVLVGTLFACGAYLILRRTQIRLILGLGLLSHAVNLLIFGSGNLNQAYPPILDKNADLATQLAVHAFADPLPQALILTAIVINFGVTAFVIVLINRRHQIAGSDVTHGEMATILHQNDPFADEPKRTSQVSLAIEDESWLSYELDVIYDQRMRETDPIPSDGAES